MVLLLLHLSLAMDDGEFDHGGGGGGSGGPVAQRQQQQWQQWTTIGGESCRQREHRQSHDGMR